ncbi:MAG: type II/IV secretion system protein [Candidatus Omnitrophica bacterium]|nr:type II/IV secretion system protein [Candidatus Omnitrophota bacterium]
MSNIKDDIKRLLKKIEEEAHYAESRDADSYELIDIEKIANQPSIVQLIDLVLAESVRSRASDIHFEPNPDELKIRSKVDGVLSDLSIIPKKFALAIVSRIKVVADLDIAERRIPQDGRISIVVDEKEIDLRVSTIPTVFGETVTLRVLDKSTIALSLEQLGLPADVYNVINRIIQKPHGIFLLTGPTGCGKTTTLYACLRKLNKIGHKLITVEDPVEYDIPGIVQVNTNPKIELTFARCLRSILRQDPDIIMVGEIRDLETAEIAMQASLTGHLVFSTLHTNDSTGAITRLIDMGIEPYLITSTLEAVLAQRLLRTLCESCKEPYEPSPDILSDLGYKAEDVKKKKLVFYKPKGCPKCNNTGFKGRVAITELLLMSEEVKELTRSKAPTTVIREKAKTQGLRTLREDGLNKIQQGIVTVEEVLRETFID